MALGPGVNNGISHTMITTVSVAGAAAVTQITNRPTQVAFVSAGNIAGAARFLKFYDCAIANSGAGMQAVSQMIIPGNAAGAGSNISPSAGQGPPAGIQFNDGLAVAITLNPAMADASGISGANDCFAWIGYR